VKTAHPMPLSTTIRNGAVAGWCTGSAGIDIAEPGYNRILIQPKPGGGLTHAGPPIAPSTVRLKSVGMSGK